MKRKGLSFEEKQLVLSEALRKKNEFFNLKEVEKIGVEAGIVFQSVKDVLQSLVDDNVVKSDKIGSQNIFWRLQSEAAADRLRSYQSLLMRQTNLQEKKGQLERQLESRTSPSYGTDQERAETVQQIEHYKSATEEIENEIRFREQHGHRHVQLMKEQLVVASEGATRWGDNIYILRSWLRHRFPNICETDINEHFEIPADLT